MCWATLSKFSLRPLTTRFHFLSLPLSSAAFFVIPAPALGPRYVPTVNCRLLSGALPAQQAIRLLCITDRNRNRVLGYLWLAVAFWRGAFPVLTLAHGETLSLGERVSFSLWLW